MMTSTTLLICLALFDVEGVFGATSYPNNPDSEPPSQWSSMGKKFQQHCSPFGISIFAKDWPRGKFLHACNMLAQMLDNDQDGCADDATVVKTIRASQAGMAMFPKNKKKNKNKNYDLVAETFNFQDLYASETELSCSGNSEIKNCRDAAIEEILHLVTSRGLGPAYPTDFGECNSNVDKISTLQVQMDISRGGHFTTIPKKYPDSAIYHYDDKTCDYGCMTTEFIYWALTSQLDGQDTQLNEISDEWEANTPAKLQAELPKMVDLLLNHPNTMELFSSRGVLPGGNSATGATGTYNPPPAMTCSNGCGLDGSGCGQQGNSFDIDSCSLPPPGGDDLNGEEACEEKGFTKEECRSIGNDNNCCDWYKGKCWSAIGTKSCLGTGPQSTVAPIPTKVPQPSPTSAPMTPIPPPPPPGGDDLNGEEACEEKRFTKEECRSIGNDNNCCDWYKGECWSAIGTKSCPGTGTQSTVAPIPTKAPQPSPTSAPMTPIPPPPPPGDDLNGEEACEEKGFTKEECRSIGNDNNCCDWYSGECWSAIGTKSCPGTGTTLPEPPFPPTSGSCVDSPLRFKVKLENGDSKFKDCAWVANDPSTCTRFSKVISHCPDTCDGCATCQDASLKFKLTINGKTANKKCKWVRKNQTEKKCDYSGVRETCRNACNNGC